MVALSPEVTEEYVIVALFALLVVRRTYRMVRGMPVSTARLVVLPALYVALYAAEVAAIGYAAVGSARAMAFWGSLAADSASFVVGTLFAYRLTLRHVHLYQPVAGGAWYYRLRPTLPIAYLVLLLVRLGVETAVLGITPFASPTAAQLDALATPTLVVLFAVDALWGLTTGFLVGRSMAVYRSWQQVQGTPPGPATPTPLP